MRDEDRLSRDATEAPAAVAPGSPRRCAPRDDGHGAARLAMTAPIVIARSPKGDAAIQGPRGACRWRYRSRAVLEGAAADVGGHADVERAIAAARHDGDAADVSCAARIGDVATQPKRQRLWPLDRHGAARLAMTATAGSCAPRDDGAHRHREEPKGRRGDPGAAGRLSLAVSPRAVLEGAAADIGGHADVERAVAAARRDGDAGTFHARRE